MNNERIVFYIDKFYHGISFILSLDQQQQQHRPKIEQFIAQFFRQFYCFTFIVFWSFLFYCLKSLFLLFFVQRYENWLFFNIKNFNGHFKRITKSTWFDLRWNWTKKHHLKCEQIDFSRTFFTVFHCTLHFNELNEIFSWNAKKSDFCP